MAAPTGSASPAISGSDALQFTPHAATDAINATYNVATFGNVQVAAALYQISSTPATTVFARGSNIGTGTASYYGAQLPGGEIAPSIIRNNAGTVTTLATGVNSNYISSRWVRVVLYVNNDGSGNVDLAMAVINLAATSSQGYYLSSTGGWSAIPQWCVMATDSAPTSALLANGSCGLRREAGATATTYADDFGVTDAAMSYSPTVSNLTVGTGSLPLLTVTCGASHATGIQSVSYLVNGVVAATIYAGTDGGSWEWQPNTTYWANGTYTIEAQAWSVARSDTPGTASTTYTVSGSSAMAVTSAGLPQRRANFRVRQSSGGGAPFPSSVTGTSPADGSYEAYVIPKTDFFANGLSWGSGPGIYDYIKSVDSTAALDSYNNYTNLYQNILVDWLNYADQNGYNREAAFGHLLSATAWSGRGGSSRAANLFWVVYSDISSTIADQTTTGTGYGVTPLNFSFGSASGDYVAFGYPDPFRELDITIGTTASGWTFAVEYPTAVDSNGNPTTWSAVPSPSDGTSAGTTTGVMTFDPVIVGTGAWVAACPTGSPSGYPGSRPGTPSTYRHYFVRIRTTGGTPPSGYVLGRNYTASIGGTNPSGTSPAFDSTADLNGDGYLDATEYPNRASGKDAYFSYEGRCLVGVGGAYGQMRFWTLPGDAHFTAWCVDYTTRLQTALGTTIVFSDNVSGQALLNTIESMTNFAVNLGLLHQAIWASMPSGNFIYLNSAGYSQSNVITQLSPACQDESFIHPLTHRATDFEGTVLARVATVAGLAVPAPLHVIDANPSATYGSFAYNQADSRLNLATLATYYCLQHDRTMLDFFIGVDPASCLAGHWTDAATVNVGDPKLAGRLSVYATGTDPAPTLQAAVEAVLQPLGYVYGTDYTVGTGNNGGPYTLTFAGALSAMTSGDVTANGAGLQAAATNATITLANHGSSTRNKYYVIYYGSEYSSYITSSGTFTLTVTTSSGTDVQTTAPIATTSSGSTNAENVAQALASLSNVGSAIYNLNNPKFGSSPYNVNVMIDENPGTIYIAFQGNLGKSDDPVLTGNFSGMSSAGGPEVTVTNIGATFTITFSGPSGPASGYLPAWGTYTLTLVTPNGTVTTAAVPVQQQATGTYLYAVYARKFPDAGRSCCSSRSR